MVKIQRPTKATFEFFSKASSLLTKKKMIQRNQTDAGLTFEGYKNGKEEKLKQMVSQVLELNKKNIKNKELDDSLPTIPERILTLLNELATEGTQLSKPQDLKTIVEYIKDNPRMMGSFSKAWQDYLSEAAENVDNESASITQTQSGKK